MPGVRDDGVGVLEQRREHVDVGVARLLHGDARPVERRGEALAPLAVPRVRAGRGARSAGLRPTPPTRRRAARRSAPRTACSSGVLPITSTSRTRRDRGRSRAERRRTPRAAARSWKTSACGQPVTTMRSAGDVVVADEVVAHPLVLHDVAVEAVPDHALADRVVPARRRSRPSSSPSRRPSTMNGVADCIWRFERTSAGRSASSRRAKRARDVAPRREVPAAHRPLDTRAHAAAGRRGTSRGAGCGARAASARGGSRAAG